MKRFLFEEVRPVAWALFWSVVARFAVALALGISGTSLLATIAACAAAVAAYALAWHGALRWRLTLLRIGDRPRFVLDEDEKLTVALCYFEVPHIHVSSEGVRAHIHSRDIVTGASVVIAESSWPLPATWDPR